MVLKGRSHFYDRLFCGRSTGFPINPPWNELRGGLRETNRSHTHKINSSPIAPPHKNNRSHISTNNRKSDRSQSVSPPKRDHAQKVFQSTKLHRPTKECGFQRSGGLWEIRLMLHTFCSVSPPRSQSPGAGRSVTAPRH